MGSDVTTLRGTSEKASQEHGDQEGDAVAVLSVKSLVSRMRTCVAG